MKTPVRPFARFGALAFLLLVALPAKAININPAVTNRWAPPRPYFCRPCANFCPVRPPVPNPGANGSNPGSSGCPTCDDESPHPGIGSVSFWQRFGRTPLVAGAPIGRMEIYEIGAARLPSGADVLRYNHPLMRRIVDRDDASDVVVVEEGNGWAVVYRGGVPVGASTGADLEIRKDAATGLFVEQLEDRTQVFYGADNTVDHLVTPDGLRLDWTNAGLDVVWDGNAIGQVWSKADGLMDVTKLSPSSFRLSWYPPAAVGEKENGRWTTTGNPGKTFTFSYSNVGGEHRLSLLEWRNETFHFDYLWKSSDGFDWTLVRDPNGLSLSESMSSTDASGLRTSVRTYSDANGLLRRTTEAYRYGANGATLVRTGVIETNGADVATWAASRIEEGPAAGRLSSTTNQYGGATIYTYDGHGRLLTETTTVFGSLEEVTSYVYETNRVDGFVDRRPRHRIVTRDGVVVSDTAYDYGFAPDGGRLDTVTRSDPVSGVSLVSSRLYYPVSPTNAAEAGRIRLSVSEDHTATLYAYAPTANGGYVRTATHGYIPEPDASAPGADALRFAIAPSQSTRTVETVNFRGDVVRVDEFVHTGEQWSPAGWTTYSYNLAHRKTGFADHKGDWEASDWICTGPVWQNLADGTAVTNTFDKAKRLATSTHYTPFGAVETTYAYNAIGEIVGTTVSTNGIPVRGTLTAYDARGRRVLSVDEQGRTNTVAYSADNRTITRTSATGAVTTTMLNTDGSTALRQGTGIAAKRIQYAILPEQGLFVEETFLSLSLTNDWFLSSQTAHNALGQVVAERTPATRGRAIVVNYSYDSCGREVGSITFSITPDLDSMFTNCGNRVTITFTSFSEIDCRETNDGTNSIVMKFDWRYIADNEGCVWRKDSSVRLVDGESPLVETNSFVRLVFPLSQNERSLTKQQNKYGGETVRRSSFSRESSKRVDTELVSWSNVDSEKVYVAGKLVSSINRSRGTTTYAYDALGQLKEKVNARGNRKQFVYDSCGRLMSTADSLGHSMQFEYSDSGLVTSLEENSYRSIHMDYDANGNQVAQWGDVPFVLKEWDGFGREIKERTTRTRIWNAQALTLDELTNCCSNSLATTVWRYDDATGLLTNKVYADGTMESYSFDPFNRLSCRIDRRGISTWYYYDGFGHLAKVDYSDGTPGKHYSYSADGRLISAIVCGSATNLYFYSTAGVLTNEVQNGQSIEYKYHLSGAVSETLATGYSLKKEFGEDGRESGLMTPNGCFRYQIQEDCPFPVGFATDQFSMKRELRDFGLADKTILYEDDSGNMLEKHSYEFNSHGRKNRHVCQRGGADEYLADYLFDTWWELTNALIFVNGNLDSEECYEYDGAGNRIVGGDSSQFEYNDNNQCILQTMTNGIFHPLYDANGNQIWIRTRTGEWNVVFDAENRPVVYSNDMAVIQMQYDYLGRRVSKTVFSAECSNRTTWVYEQQRPICMSNNGNPPCMFYWMIQEGRKPVILEMEGESGVFRYTTDANGNVGSLVSTNGQRIGTYRYDSFGTIVDKPADIFNPIAWNSEWYDEDLDLVMYLYREYNPSEGRWSRPDPLKELIPYNPYLYCGNDPIGQSDRYGLLSPIFGWLADCVQSYVFSLVSRRIYIARVCHAAVDGLGTAAPCSEGSFENEVYLPNYDDSALLKSTLICLAKKFVKSPSIKNELAKLDDAALKWVAEQILQKSIDDLVKIASVKRAPPERQKLLLEYRCSEGNLIVTPISVFSFTVEHEDGEIEELEIPLQTHQVKCYAGGFFHTARAVRSFCCCPNSEQSELEEKE